MSIYGFTYHRLGTSTYRVRRQGEDVGRIWRTRTAWAWQKMDGTQGETRDGASRESAALRLILGN